MAQKIKVSNKEYILKYTFNSFRYMEDICISDDLDNYPFRAFSIVEGMMLGALNWTPNKLFTKEDAQNIITEYLDQNEDITIQDLMMMLQEEIHSSNFFKSTPTTQSLPVKSKKNS